MNGLVVSGEGFSNGRVGSGGDTHEGDRVDRVEAGKSSEEGGGDGGGGESNHGGDGCGIVATLEIGYGRIWY